MKKPEEAKTPPLKLAVALQYDGTTAPKVTAKGSGDLAEQILAIAEENGVPLHNDMELVKFLASFDLGDEIPPALYRVVAEVIAFAYLVRGKFPENWNPSNT
jgi:flagellar biosynthesis protein